MTPLSSSIIILTLIISILSLLLCHNNQLAYNNNALVSFPYKNILSYNAYF